MTTQGVPWPGPSASAGAAVVVTARPEVSRASTLSTSARGREKFIVLLTVWVDGAGPTPAIGVLWRPSHLSTTVR